MAAADKLKTLIVSYGEGDDARFFATAMQIAAAEARQGHASFAQELKNLIEKAKKERSSLTISGIAKTITISTPKRELQELIEVFQPRIKLKDLILSSETKETLDKVIAEQAKWELLRKFNLNPIRKILLTGPPGTGKTMTAQALAGELQIPVYIVRLDGLISKYMGESISKLRLIFDAMQDHRAVYLFDEFDSIGSHRDISSDVGEIKRVLNSFLINIEKDESNSIIICATNLPQSLDKALFRRFDEIINYSLPNKDQIELIIKIHTNTYTFSKRPTYKKLSEIAIGLNHSEIVKACEDTLKEMILTEKKKLSFDYLEQSLEKRKKVYAE